MPEAILSELMSAITNKLKFVVCPINISASLYDVLSGPETLSVAHEYWYPAPTDLKMLPEILNKRWQTLDVKSIMSVGLGKNELTVSDELTVQFGYPLFCEYS